MSEETTTLERVRALRPEIAARAEEIEGLRALPRDIAGQPRSAGVFRRYVPRAYGGDEMWPDEGLTVIEELARADASVAWVAAPTRPMFSLDGEEVMHRQPKPRQPKPTQ